MTRSWPIVNKRSCRSEARSRHRGRIPIDNAVEIFQNGAFFDALLEDISAARRTVHVETFLWKEGVLGRRMADAFSKQARAGVKVRCLTPGCASSNTARRCFTRR